MKKAALIFLTFFSAQNICTAQSNELANIKKILPTIQDSLRYVDALNRMAILYYEKNIDSTFYHAAQARSIAERLEYAKGKADALNNLAISFNLKGSLQLALRYYDEAYLGYIKLKDSSNCVQALMNIAMVYKAMEKEEKAIQRFNSALDLGKKLTKDSIMSLAIYNYLLQYSARFTQPETNRLIGKARQIAIKYKDERTLLAIDQLLADELIKQGKREEGIRLLEHTIEMAIAKKLYYVSMDMIIDMGNQLMSTDPSEAIAYYERGLEISNQHGYLIYSKVINQRLFDVYVKLKNPEKAVEYSKELLKVIDEQEKLDNYSGVDYIDYALKDQQVRSLQTRSAYQTALLVISSIAIALAIAAIIVFRKNLGRTKRLHELVIKQNNTMKKTLIALEQSQADNTRMMKIAAHDLRNPIGGISSLVSIMLAERERPADDLEMLSLIKKSAENSLELVGDLLEVQFGSEAVKKEPVDLSEILQYCVSLLQSQAEAKHQDIHLQSTEFILLANREKLWRVISNLVSNAIKFSPTGAIIEISMEVSSNDVCIKVKDNGIGIPPEMRDKIFDMFTDAKRLGTDGEKTYGLGLSITKQIVEAHGGQIWFESTPNQGTTFFVSLPI